MQPTAHEVGLFHSCHGNLALGGPPAARGFSFGLDRPHVVFPSPIAADRNRSRASSTSVGRRRTLRPHLMLGTRRALIQRHRRRCEIPRRAASVGMFEYMLLLFILIPRHCPLFARTAARWSQNATDNPLNQIVTCYSSNF